MNKTNCPVCGEVATIKRISKAFGQGDDLMVIEEIPLITCRNCHEHYITAETLYEIELLREQHQPRMRMIHVGKCAA